MIKSSNSKKYDLEDRTLEFAKKIRDFIKELPKTVTNNEYNKQLIRSSGSIGANYIEANESLSKKDFIMRIKICRKESKESIYWLHLIDIENINNFKKEKRLLINKATELMKIFSAIMRKSE